MTIFRARMNFDQRRSFWYREGVEQRNRLGLALPISINISHILSILLAGTVPIWASCLSHAYGGAALVHEKPSPRVTFVSLHVERCFALVVV
jgi:hypothetical protein